MRDSEKYSIDELRRLAMVAVCAFALGCLPSGPVTAADLTAEETTGSPSGEALESADGPSTPGSARAPLQGGTEVTEVILEEQPLYQQAMKSIDEEDYGRALGYLQQLGAQFGEGYEPYKAECMYYEAGCHQMLQRQRAATDMYRKAYDLFAKYDDKNPLKAKAFAQFTALKGMESQKGSYDKPNSNPMNGGISLNELVGEIENNHFRKNPQKSLIAINPEAQLAVRDNNKDIPLLEVNDRRLLPLIVTECFSDMNCLETAEIGSNVTNAANSWMPLMVHGRSAAFGIDGHANPAFKAVVNGRSYNFDVILPDLQAGLRKVLLLTNKEKICAVDVDSFDTWLLRLQPAKDGRITSARWYKLTHVKPHGTFESNIAKPTIRHPASRRNW
jgi:hypothetical protein